MHYAFDDVGGYAAFWNSIKMAALTAVIGAFVTFTSAYLIDKTKGAVMLRRIAYFLSILPLALPGLVIGIAYIFFFNKTHLSIPFTGIELRVTGYGLRVAGCGLRVTGYELRVTANRFLQFCCKV